MRTPTYIVKNKNGIYYFRYVIPISQAHLFPKNRREIRRSLNTRVRAEALKRARIYWVKMNKEKIDSFEREIYAENDKIARGNFLLGELEQFKNIQGKLYDYEEYIAQLTDYDIECLQLADKHQHSQKLTLSTQATSATEQPTSYALDDLFDKYLKDKGNIDNKTLNGYRRQFKLFIRITAISTTSDLDTPIIRDYKETLPQLPPRVGLDKALKRKTIQQILARASSDKLNVKTVNENFRTVKAFLKWLSVQEYVDKDYSALITNIKSRQLTKANAARAVFTNDDLNKLFGTSEYQTDGFRKYSYRYWLPLLALYTGARTNELCQLSVADIQTLDNVLVIDINNKQDKKVKTTNAIRKIPVHKTLLALGFEEYVATVKAKKETKLFPALTPDNDGYCTRKISRFFNATYKSHTGYQSYCGVKKASETGDKVFYSFRHTFINQWKQQDLNTSMLKQVVGHANSDITDGLYGKDYPINKVHAELNKINFNIKPLPMKWCRRLD